MFSFEDGITPFSQPTFLCESCHHPRGVTLHVDQFPHSGGCPVLV